MAINYDAPRKSEEDPAAESLEGLQPVAGKVRSPEKSPGDSSGSSGPGSFPSGAIEGRRYGGCLCPGHSRPHPAEMAPVPPEAIDTAMARICT
jgi:hypothetical protein